MRYHLFLKIFLEWIILGIFFFLVITTFISCYGSEEVSRLNGEEIEQEKSVDNGDLEVKVATTRPGSGVVWGNAQVKTPSAATPATPAAKPVLPSPAPALPVPSTASSHLTAAPTKPNLPKNTTEKYLLKSGRQKGMTDLVETLLEVTGEAVQVNSDLKETKEKMEVVAGFRYEERVEQFSQTNQLSSARQYNLAKSKMKVGESVRMPELSSELQTIVCTLDKDKVSLFSPHGSLRGEQLLLIEDIPGNTLTLDRLLPNTEMAIGESWKIGDAVLRSFLSVDAVLSSNVEAVLTAVVDNMAMIEVVGDVNGVYLGATTEISMRAKLQFDLSIQRINWLGAMIEENRSIGHVGPGVELVAKLQVKISPLDSPQSLTDTVMKKIVTKPNPSVLQLKYDGGKGPWRFSHDRSWYIYQDDSQTTVLRRLENGDLIAQCNIADMGTVDLKTMTTLAKFQQDLIVGLGNNFGTVVSAREYENERGYKIYKVLLDGTVDDLSLRWLYHLVTDKTGRQSIVVFVVEAAMFDQFANTDDVLLETYRMGQ